MKQEVKRKAWNKGLYGEKRKSFDSFGVATCEKHGTHKAWYFSSTINQLYCKFCSQDRSREYNYKHPFAKFITWAKQRKMEIDINESYIAELYLNQNGICALSGIELSENNMSLDRIDSDKGYIRGNVQWVDYYINRMKTDLKERSFIELCNMVTKANEKK